mgnify:CR=1 FL=1
MVHKDELPLIVDAGKVFIKDIGTQYNVVAQPDSDSLYVHVDEGEVSLYDESGFETRIKRAESAFYIKSQEKIETVLSIIVETLGVTYEKNKEGFIIKGEKCNH